MNPIINHVRAISFHTSSAIVDFYENIRLCDVIFVYAISRGRYRRSNPLNKFILKIQK